MLLSTPQLIANGRSEAWRETLPEFGGGSRPGGIAVTPVNRGALLTVTEPGTFVTWLERP